MSRHVQALVLFMLGGALLRISIGETYLRYVKSALRPWVILTGALLVILAVYAMVELIREERAAKAGVALADGYEHDVVHGGHDDGHGHSNRHLWTAWLLLIPVAAILLVSPPALGAWAAGRSQPVVQQPTSDDDFPALPATNPVPLALNEYAVRAVWDDHQSLAGHNIELVGFVTPIPASKQAGLPPNSHFWITRMMLTCCAADAVTTKIVAVDAPDLPANTWVKIVGQWTPGGGTNVDTAIPWIKTQNLTRIPQPTDPYE